MIGETNTDGQTYIWMDINGQVKVAVILSKIIFFFSSIKLLHAHVQYIFNESAKYQKMSTSSLRQFDFTKHGLSQTIQNPVVVLKK